MISMKTNVVSNINFSGYSGLASFRIADKNSPAALSSVSFILDNEGSNDLDSFCKVFPEVEETKGLLTVLNISGVSAKDYSPVNILNFNNQTIIQEMTNKVSIPYKKGNAMGALEFVAKFLPQVYKDVIEIESPVKIVSNYKSAGASISALSFNHSERIVELTKLFIDDYYSNGVEVDKSVLRHTIKHIDKLVRKYIM